MIREQSRPETAAFDDVVGPGFLPRVGVIEGVRRHKLLAVLPVTLLVAGALFYGLYSTPTYRAEARQIIGRIDVNQPGALAGFTDATATLATSYSRAIYSSAVVDAVARRTGLTPDQVRARLGAYPIPESAVFVVAGKGPSESDAIKVAREGVRALQAYIEEINTENPNAERLFREFEQAALERARLRDELQRARVGAGDSATIRADLAAANLEVGVARRNYGAATSSQSTVSLVQNLTLPESASNDRFERLQLVLFIAVAAGVLLGLALATLRANQEVRRALSVP